MSDLVEKVAKVIQYHGHPSSIVRAKAAIKVVADEVESVAWGKRLTSNGVVAWLLSQLEET